MKSNTEPKETDEPNGIEITHLELLFDQKTRILRAKTSENCGVKVDLASLQNFLSEKGYGRVETSPAILSDLVQKLSDGKACEVNLGKVQPAILLNFSYDASTRELAAIIEETEVAPEYNFASIKRQIDDEGYGSYDIKTTAISDLLLKIQNKKMGRVVIGRKPEFTKAAFHYDEESRKLFADLSFTEEEQLVSRSSLSEQLASLGYSEFFLQPNALEQLFNQINKNERGRFEIGEKRDARIEVECDEEFMTAYMTVSPPQGGRQLDEHLLEKALGDAGIYRDTCDEKVIAKIIADKSADKILFASGTEPTNGVDAQFEALVEEVVYNNPKESKTGKVDLREVVSFTLIDENIPVMRRIPAKHGMNGRNVKGQVITAVESVDTPFDDNFIGVKISDHDPNLLISTSKGHPCIQARGVKVDSTVIVNNVDMSTGNINYDGSVLVKGEVKAGMKIKVTGDIIVKGVVTKATLHAKNNITVECGVIGSDPTKDGETSPPAVLKAGGTITAQYVNLTELSAGNNIEVKEYLSHCNCEAKNKIIVGESGGKGKIFGGKCYGHAGITATSIGANGGVKTHITVGIPESQMQQFEQLKKTHKNRSEQHEQLSAMLTKYEEALENGTKDAGIAKKAQAIKKVLGEIDVETKKMSDTINKLGALFKESKYAQVSIKKETFPNVNMIINGASFSVRQESKGGIFVREGNDVRWRNYTAD